MPVDERGVLHFFRGDDIVPRLQQGDGEGSEPIRFSFALQALVDVERNNANSWQHSTCRVADGSSKARPLGGCCLDDQNQDEKEKGKSHLTVLYPRESLLTG